MNPFVCVYVESLKLNHLDILTKKIWREWL